ncbi:MAG: PorT family protein [Crocinitomicaceae bacterium]|nr:PorT family protein [Crocinitomicaceae bacterium]
MNFRDEETYQFFEEPNSSNENQEFEFKDSYWDEMEAMLDAHDSKKKKRRGAFIWFSSASVVIALLFGLSHFGVFSPMTPSSSKGSVAIDQENSAQSVVIQASEVDQKANLEENTPSVNDGKGSNQNGFVAQSKRADVAYHSNTKANKNLHSKQNQEDLEVEKVENHIVADQNLADPKMIKDQIVEDEELTSLAMIPVQEIPNNLDQSIILENRKVKFQKTHHLFTNAEAGIVNKYGPNKGVSYGVSAGLGYELGFHKNLAFQVGAQLNYREGLSQNYVNESKIYGFKSQRYYQEVDYKGQFEIEIPVALKIKLNRHSINAGVGTSFLLGVRSKVEQYIPESTGVENYSSNFGIKDGIRKLDVKLNLQYGYAVSRNLEFTAGVSAGLLDQTSNEFFGNTDKDLNMQFRAGIKYFFFNK